jgi:hypothetical protein
MRTSIALIILAITVANAAAAKPAKYFVRSPTLTIELTERGEITGPFDGRTELAGCREAGPGEARELAPGGCAFTRKLVDEKNHRCIVTDRFTPTKSSVRWEIEIRSDDAPWTTAIETRVKYPATPASRFWTTWGHADNQRRTWGDPLESRPFAARTWRYQYSQWPDVCNANPPADFFSMPLFSVIEPASDTAISLVQSPEDTLLDLTLRETATGEICLSRQHYRLGGGKPVRFAMDLVAHPADVRAALDWMVKRYPQFFNPGIPLADKLSGGAAYSGCEQPFDADRMRRMGFAYNWKCSEDFPYMGLFLPPVADAQTRWTRAPDEQTPGKPATTSFQQMNDYARWMKRHGFHVLSYFNVTEYGRGMQFPPPPRQAKTDADLWRNPHDYLFHGGLGSAVVMNGKQPVRSNCYGALIVDPGDTGYRQHLLAQAQRNATRLPDVDGLCIDRTDWLNSYNFSADDGVSWVNGQPARSLFVSWKELMTELSPALHRAGKVVFVNNCTPRIEVVGLADGIYSEWGSDAWANQSYINFTALTGVRKPAAIWTVNEGELTDAYMQRLLYLGIFPTAPYPNNNHCLRPSKRADEQFLAYGPLLNAMRGRKWVLAPHCVATDTPGAKVNLFEVPGGYALPVSFAGNATVATVRVRGVGQVKCEAICPGIEKPIALTGKHVKDMLELTVPLMRGCAMVRLSGDRL